MRDGQNTTPTTTWGHVSRLAAIIGGVVAGIIVLTFVVAAGVALSQDPQIKAQIATSRLNEVIVYVVSWLLLAGISIAATLQVRDVLRATKNDPLMWRANWIAIIIALVLVIFLFRQPYLDQIFSRDSTAGWLNAVLFGGGATLGWTVWYLRQLKLYGEFFHCLLMTAVTGLCWYARLTAPEEVQLTAIAFLLGSLFRIAKDYMDEAAKRRPI